MQNNRGFDEAVRLFVEAAIRQGKSTEIGDWRSANAAHAEVLKAVCELRLSTNWVALLISLLKHPEPGVVLWAGVHLLRDEPDAASAALEELAAIPKSLVGFDAEMTLKLWREGQLKAP